MLILLFICLLLDRTCYTLLVGLDLSSFSASAYNVLFTGHVSLVNEQWSLLKSAEYAAKSLSLKIEAQRSSPSALDKALPGQSRSCPALGETPALSVSTLLSTRKVRVQYMHVNLVRMLAFHESCIGKIN